MDQPLPAHSSKTDRSLSHPTIQSDLDSQTAPTQARNNASAYSAALSHGQRTGFTGGMADVHSDRHAILFQMIQGCAFAVPQEISVLIGHLTRDADLVAAEVMGLLAVFAVFVDVVLLGETTYVRTAHTLRQD